MKIYYIISVFMIVIGLSILVTGSMLIPVNDNAKENAKAPENSPVIDNDWGLERVDFIHYVKPENAGNSRKTSTCYKLMGVKWKSLPVNYAIDYSATYGVQDFKNSIDFADYPNDGVIAVTSVWYTRVGKQIVEFDQRYNTRFAWGDATIDSSKMDLENIAVHELGHAVGLADIYSTSCLDVTMYGYSTEGETSKITLEQPDITGLQTMYGI